jgi:hypothetical protein
MRPAPQNGARMPKEDQPAISADPEDDATASDAAGRTVRLAFLGIASQAAATRLDVPRDPLCTSYAVRKQP